jgi:putative transposase
MRNPFRYFKTSPEIIRLAVMMYVRFPLSLRFVSIHASVHNHFNQERHLRSRQIFKLNRLVALAEWRKIAA